MKNNICKHKRIRCNECRESRTPFYRRWWHIRARCTFKWDKDYDSYGGRGIKFEWETYQDFKNDMYESFIQHVNEFGNKDTTIDRIDVNGNYNKNNCKWVTRYHQELNKRRSRLLTVNGITKNVSVWAREIGCSSKALMYRLNIGMNPDEILTVPFKHSNKHGKTIPTPKKNNSR